MEFYQNEPDNLEILRLKDLQRNVTFKWLTSLS